MAMIVLERKVKDRWRSIRYARETRDWNVQGSAEHKAKVEAANPGPISELFQFTHNTWFQLIRRYNRVMNTQNPVVEVSYEDVTEHPIEDTQQLVREKIMNWTVVV